MKSIIQVTLVATLVSGLGVAIPLTAMTTNYPNQAAALDKAFPTRSQKMREQRDAFFKISAVEAELKAVAEQIDKLGDEFGFEEEFEGIADSLQTKATILKALAKCRMDKEKAESEETSE